MQHIFSFKCALYCGGLEYQKICQDTTPPLEISTTKGSNSWKNGCQNSVTIHHCFNEPGATVAKEGRKTMLLRCISAFKFPFVNYSLIRGRNDHQNVSKFSPYRVGQFVTKTGPIYTWICEIWLKGRVFLIELNSVEGRFQDQLSLLMIPKVAQVNIFLLNCPFISS